MVADNSVVIFQASEIELLDAKGIVTPKLSAVQGRATFYWTSASEMLDRMDRYVHNFYTYFTSYHLTDAFFHSFLH